MSKKKVHHEEHVDETWLIPYADMLTLLLALFIVMFAMGQVDKQKLQQISEQFNIIFSGGSGHFEKEGSSVVPPVKPYKSATVGDVGDGKKTKSAIEDEKMKEIKELLEKEIKKVGYSEKILLTLDKEGLDISVQDTVLFASGNANVIKDASNVLNTVAKMLKDIDNTIKVIGHTDNIPIKNGQFRSNWDLSAMRAINVMEFMINTGQLNPNRFIIQGNGEYSPKYDNSTSEGRAKNRRVDICVVRKYPLSEVEEKAVSEDKTTTKPSQ